MLNDKAKIASLSVLFCRAVFLIGAIDTFVQYYQYIRLPVIVYFLFGAVQLSSVFLQFVRRNFLTAIFGLCQTAILIYAALIEASPQLDFDATFAVNVYTPFLIE